MRLQHIFDSKHLAREIIKILEETLGYEHAAILIADELSESLTPFAVSDQGEGPGFVEKDFEYISSKNFRRGFGITGWVAEQGKAIRSKDVRQDHRYVGIRDDITSELCVPMLFRGQVIGVINIESATPNAYSESDERILEIIASQVAVAIENNRLHQALVQSQKMDAIGRLTSGISHDFNNLLTVINGFTEILLDRNDLTGEPRKYLEKIELAGRQAAEITHKLLAFSRKSVAQPTIIDPNEQIEKLSELITGILNSKIEFCTNLARDVGHVEFDPTHFCQILMNLASNASDSMPDGGRLTVSTSNFTSQTASTEGFAAKLNPGNYLLIEFADTGMGITENAKSAIFRPFFSTKATGTGLGLAMVAGMVEQGGGAIRVSSEMGIGSVFKIFLPVVEKSSTPVEHNIVTPETFSSGTCLIIEDDELVRNLVTTFVESLNFSTLAASNGAEAIQLAADPNAKIDLVIVDMIVSGLLGPSLVKLIREIHPDAKVLYMSGYPADSFDGNDANFEEDQLITKPFTRTQLKQKLVDVFPVK